MLPDRGKTCDLLREMCKLTGENTHLCMFAGKGKINMSVLEWASMCQQMGNKPVREEKYKIRGVWKYVRYNGEILQLKPGGNNGYK